MTTATAPFVPIARGAPAQRLLRGTKEDVAALRRTETTRARSRLLLERARLGESDVFRVEDERLDAIARYEADVARERRGDRAIHGRMRHFDAGGRSRSAELAERLVSLDPEERARVKIDLIVPSVLLDAGAGAAWSYDDEGVRLVRSEGLAVASFRMFVSGAFSSDGYSLRTDADGLARLDPVKLARGFQVSDDNPIVGLEGRAHVLSELANALRSDVDRFGTEGRPGHLFDWAKSNAVQGRIDASAVLGALLHGLSSIWPGRFSVAGENLGDVWPHPALGHGVDGLVPFHKLSQWLTVSLVEPFLDGGLEIVGLDQLTHLPEYRNGGLLLDLGALVLRDDRHEHASHRVDEPLVVEWRALTVALLDEIAPRVRHELEEADGPLSMRGTLDGATWLAGRRIAAERRPGGGPPLAIDSDGTVF